MKNKLTVGLKDLKRQLRLVDEITHDMTKALADMDGNGRDVLRWHSRRGLNRRANDLDGLANFLSELNAAVKGSGAVVVYRGKD